MSVQPSPPPKIADRPHTLTILLTGTSVLFAALSMFISLSSYRVADKNMKIAQRAYVDVRLSIPQEITDQIKNSEENKGEQEFYLNVSLNNAGNTPALNVRFEPPVVKASFPSTWLDTPKPPFIKVTGMDSGPVNVYPKSERLLRVEMRGTADAVRSLINGSLPDTTMCFTASYTDVFGEQATSAHCFGIVDSHRAWHYVGNGSVEFSSDNASYPVVVVRPRPR
jgi:hypothetical protein